MTPTTVKIFIQRIDDLIELANEIGRKKGMDNLEAGRAMGHLRSASLSLIEALFGRAHSYYTEFNAIPYGIGVPTGQAAGILTAIRNELDGGWLNSARALISAEVFADFLEMADHLLDQGYKDPAAVMIGSVLEEHLRQLAVKHSVAVEDPNGQPHKADRINAELARVGVYDKLDQKQITAWLDLRNKAAHGKYSEYDDKQVRLMFGGVHAFMGRVRP